MGNSGLHQPTHKDVAKYVQERLGDQGTLLRIGMPPAVKSILDDVKHYAANKKILDGLHINQALKDSPELIRNLPSPDQARAMVRELGEDYLRMLSYDEQVIIKKLVSM